MAARGIIEKKTKKTNKDLLMRDAYNEVIKKEGVNDKNLRRVLRAEYDAGYEWKKWHIRYASCLLNRI